jgi:putative flippase GtrA
MRPTPLVRELFQTLRAGLAGILATAVDLLVLTVLVSGFHVDAQIASIPALLAGGVANFIGNRHFAFRAREGSLARQVLLYTLVEVLALGYGGLLYDTALRLIPAVKPLYWAVRLVTSHIVFLTWSYPLWRRVFATPRAAPIGAGV